MQSSPDKHQQFLGVLDDIERGVVRIYRIFLGFVIAAVVAVVGVVVVQRPWGAGNQGEWFYFGIVVLLVLGWACGQFIALGRRKTAAKFPIRFLSSKQDGSQSWELQLGSRPVDRDESSEPSAGSSLIEFSQSFDIPLAAVMHEMLPDEETIRAVEAEVDRGALLEEACQRT